jgi:hypothetical protein
MRSVRTFAVVVFGFVVSCGDALPATPSDLILEGEGARASRDWETAFDAFTEARAMMSPNHKDIWIVRMGQLEAEAHLEPARAKEHVLELTKNEPGKLSADDYATIASALAQSSPTSALEVVAAGVEQFPESASLLNLGPRLRKLAEEGNKPDSVKDLEKLGY